MSYHILELVVILINKDAVSVWNTSHYGDHVFRSPIFSIICTIHDMISQILAI
jgi:hypothetical protein